MSKLLLARASVAAVALALILLPGEVWSAPESDYDRQGFDEDLVYVDAYNRSLFDPFLVLENGTWAGCPCEPGTELTIAGSGLAGSRTGSTEGAYELDGVQVLVAGEPAALHLVSPGQINFVLPEDISGTSASISVVQDGVEWARDAVAIGPRTGAEDDVAISSSELRLTPSDGHEPAVHLLTTPLSFSATFTATIHEQSGDATPLRATLWNPRNFSGFSIIFDSSGIIAAEFAEGRGRIASLTRLGGWKTGTPYEVQVQWERDERAFVSVAGPNGTSSAQLTAAEAPALFDAYRPSLTVVGVAHDGSSDASITDYNLKLLPARFTTIRVDDPLVPILTTALAVIGAALLLATASPVSALRTARRAVSRWAAGARAFAREHPLATATLIIGGAAYVALNGFLFTLGSQPFDMGSQARWSHVTVVDGLTDIYYAAQVATLAGVWNGTPYHEAVFPYNAGMSYYFWGIGELHQLLFGHTDPDSQSLHVMIKSFNFAFMIADAVLVYALIRHLKPEARHLPWVGAAMLLLNPSFIFDTAVWGETESVVLFPLLASLLAALKDRPGVAWSMLALAFLSKQTILLAVLIIGVWYLMRFPFRRNVESFSGALMVVLAIILPFTLSGYPPSIAIDPTLAALWVHGAAGAESIFQVVSYDAFNVWTLVTHVADGASGVERFQFPDHDPSLGSLSYHRLGSLLLAPVVLSLLGFMVWKRKQIGEHPEVLLTLLAVLFVAELFLPTRTLSRYFLFATVFAGIGMAGRARWAAIAAVVGLTVTSLVGQYGSLALVIEDFPMHAPDLAPQVNVLSRVMADLFVSDVFITIAVLLNGGSLALLTGAMWLQTRLERQAAASESPAEATPPEPLPEPAWALTEPRSGL